MKEAAISQLERAYGNPDIDRNGAVTGTGKLILLKDHCETGWVTDEMVGWHH